MPGARGGSCKGVTALPEWKGRMNSTKRTMGTSRMIEWTRPKKTRS
jgi:hypothetical protein